MANFDNLATKKVNEEMRETYKDGLLDGWLQGWLKGRHITDFMNKPYVQFSPYERGYIMGYGLYLEEVGKY